MFRRIETGESVLEWPSEKGQCVFVCGRVLGKGGFGKCYELHERETGSRFACKIIDKKSEGYQTTRQKVASEISLHKKLRHRNIVRFQRYHEDEHFIYLLLELCNNNTLDDILHRRKHLHEIEVRYYFHQILQGVKYIHDQKIVHRDLKLQNFFISEQMTIKIGDFGLASSLLGQKRRKSICGTPNYMAPEIFCNKDGYAYEIDLWSLGVIGFLLMNSRFPFEKNDINFISTSIKSKNYLHHTNLSEKARSLLTAMLQFNPSERLSIKEVLKHDFFTQYDIPETIPLSCLICKPTSNLTEKYANPKIATRPDDDEKFQFMLESKESLNNQGQIIRLQYQQIDSIIHERVQPPTAAKICSFGYESRKINSCHIKKWVVEYWEYARYGLLYRLSDGILGMRFNDGSNLQIADHTKLKYSYISCKGEVQNIDLRNVISGQIQLKINILVKLVDGMAMEQIEGGGDILYLRLYINSVKAFILWLSNEMIQARYGDGSQLVISRDSCMYIDKSKLKIVFASENINDQSDEILSKKKIVEDVIRRIKRIRSQNEKDKQNIKSLSQFQYDEFK